MDSLQELIELNKTKIMTMAGAFLLGVGLGLFPLILWFGWFVLLPLILGMGVFGGGIYYTFHYPVNVTIFERRAGNRIKIVKTRARRHKSKEQGFAIYRFENGRKTKPVKFDYQYIGGRGKEEVFLYSPARGIFLPMEMEEGSTKIKVLDEDMIQWTAGEYQTAERKFTGQPSAFQKWFPFILIFVTCIGIAIIWYLALRDISKVTDGLGGLANSIGQYTEMMLKVTQNATVPPY